MYHFFPFDYPFTTVYLHSLSRKKLRHASISGDYLEAKSETSQFANQVHWTF